MSGKLLSQEARVQRGNRLTLCWGSTKRVPATCCLSQHSPCAALSSVKWMSFLRARGQPSGPCPPLSRVLCSRDSVGNTRWVRAAAASCRSQLQPGWVRQPSAAVTSAAATGRQQMARSLQRGRSLHRLCKGVLGSQPAQACASQGAPRPLRGLGGKQRPLPRAFLASCFGNCLSPTFSFSPPFPKLLRVAGYEIFEIFFEKIFYLLLI